MTRIVVAENACRAIYEVKTDKFIDTFLYPPTRTEDSPLPPRSDYREIAESFIEDIPPNPQPNTLAAESLADGSPQLTSLGTTERHPWGILRLCKGA